MPGLPGFSDSELKRAVGGKGALPFDLGSVRTLKRAGGSNPVGTVSLHDGLGCANSARVTGGNNLGVDSRYTEATVVTTQHTLNATPAMDIAIENQNRIGIQIQNQDPTNPAYVNFGADATVNSYRIDPGVTYTFPAGAVFSGRVSGIGGAAGVVVVVVEFTAV